MSYPYSNKQPIDRMGVPKQDVPPAVVAIQTNASDNNANSSVITLTANTTDIEVGAAGGGAVIKWITSASTNPSVISDGGTANFDHFIGANTVRKFVVPVEKQGIYSVVGLNAQAGLYARVAVKSVGIASVLTTQY
jgi:hypothetical protein